MSLGDRISDWIDNGPKNKVLRYIVYYPVMILLGLASMALLMIIPEFIAYLFGAACILGIVVWPCIKLHEWLTSRKQYKRGA